MAGFRNFAQGFVLNPTQVPTVPVEFDAAHPFMVGLLGYWLLSGGVPRDLTGRYGAATAGPSGSPSVVAGAAGPGNSWSGLSNIGWAVNSGPIIGNLAAWSVFATIQTGASGNGSGRAIYNERAPSGLDVIQFGETGGVNFTCIGRNDSGTITVAADGVAINDNTIRTLVATFDGTNIRLYQNGVLTNTSGWVGAAGAFTNSGIISSIGFDVQNSAAYWSGDVYQVGVLSTVLSQGAITQLAAEPFAMLRPIARRQYFVGASSGNTTLNPSAGSIVLTGHAPTIAAGATLHPAAGAIALTGHVPTIAAAANTTLSPVAGSVAIIGHIPTLAAGLKLTPAAGSIVFTGHVPTVTPGTAAITLNPLSGSILFQGQVPQIYAGVPFKGGGSGDGEKARQRWLDWRDKKARSKFEAKKASAGKVAPAAPKVVAPEVAPASPSGEMTAVAPPLYAAEIRVDLLEAAIDAEVSAALSEDDDVAIILMEAGL